MDGLTSRDLSRLVLSPDWSLSKAPPVDLATLEAAWLELSNPASLKSEDPALCGEAVRRIDAQLRPIGAKIDPTIASGAAADWRAAIILALSDLPARIVEYAVGKALHRPMNFLNQVEGTIREIADEAVEKQRIAAAKLRHWKSAIERATNDQKRLQAPDAHEWSPEQVEQANADFARIGIKTRYRLVGGKVETYQATPDDRERERAENGAN